MSKLPTGSWVQKKSYVDGRDGFTQIVNGSIFYGDCGGLLNFFIQTGLALGIYHSRSKQRTDQKVLELTLKFLALKKLVFSP